MDNLNPGIKETVKLLQQYGFNTCDSGDGQTHDHPCDLPFPYVHMKVEPDKFIDEADRLFEFLSQFGIDFSEPFDEDGTPIGPHIECHYTPGNQLATMSVFFVNDQLLGLCQSP